MAMKVVLLLVVLAVVQAVQAAEHTVNWGFHSGDLSGSAHTTTYYVGDTLVFNYVPEAHNVVKVNQEEFNDCATNLPLVYGAGQTKVTLHESGTHYYICSVPGHCTDGMKIKVVVKHHHHA